MLVGVVVTLVPAAIMWVITGPPFATRLPGPDVLNAATDDIRGGSVLFVGVEYAAFVRRRRGEAAKQRDVAC